MADGPSTWHSCWTPQSVQETIFGDVATLRESERAIFLATHTALPIRKSKGPKMALRGDAGRSILAELEKSLKSRQNTLIAVVGPSGSGKTHLVRWVNSHLDTHDARFCLVYVPKQANTLRSIIGRILDALPPSSKSEEVRAALEHSFETAKPAQLRKKLFDALDTHLTFVLEEEPGEATSWSNEERHARRVILGERDPSSDGERPTGLGALLRTPELREHLLRRQGHLDAIISSLLEKRQGGDEQLPEFDAETLSLSKNEVRSRLPAGPITKTWEAVHDHPLVVAKILNEALPGATAEALGLSRGTDINEVFNEARRLLKAQQRQLVLVFEDLAQFGMLDGAILDQFRNQPQDDLAPLRAVFAITTGKYDQLGETVKTKVDHEYQMDELDIYDSDYRDLADTLTTKFLNLARLGSERVLRAYETADEETRLDGTWVPNKCLDVNGSGEVCPHQTSCWDGFGHVGDIGFFPYNSAALGKALNGQRERGESATPRTIVERLVQDFLLDAYQEFDTKEFPSRETRSRFSHKPLRSPVEIVRGIQGSIDEVERVRRVREIWADELEERPEVREWFNLPDPMEEYETPPSVAHVPESTTVQEPSPQSIDGRHSELIEWSSNEEPLGEVLVRDLRQYLYAATLDRSRLGDFLIDVEKSEAKNFVARFFTPNSFVFRTEAEFGKEKVDFGMVPSDHFEKFSVVVEKKYEILAGALWFSDNGSWSPGEENRWGVTARTLSEIRIAYDAFVDDCALRIRQRTLKEIGEKGRPASEAIWIRSLAAQSVGLLPVGADSASALKVALDTSLVPPRDSNFDSSWHNVVQAARQVLADVDCGWVEAFSGVSQGAGGLHAVHAEGLRRAAGAALNIPDEVALHTPSEAELGRLAEPFLSTLEASLEAQRERLCLSLSRLRALLPASICTSLAKGDVASFHELIDHLQSVGMLARDRRVFRQQEHSGPFLDDCGKIRAFNAEVLCRWFSVWQGDGETLSNTATIELQATAVDLAWMCERLKFLFDCLLLTSAEVQRRVGGHEKLGEVQEVQVLVEESLGQVIKALGPEKAGADDV